jgi:hypothetical protein
METDMRNAMTAGVLALALSVGLPAADKPAAKWARLWDGKTLKGWHVIGKGTWTIEKGVLVGRHAKADADYGHLVTDATYGDFQVRVVFKSLKGNSGLYFRIEEKGASGVSGFQAEIDPRVDVGGLYETNGRGWVVKPTAKEIKKFFKVDDWNTMVVRAKGNKVRVEVNGVKSAEIDDPKGRKKGKIALQLHGGQDVLVMFKEVSIIGKAVGK